MVRRGACPAPRVQASGTRRGRTRVTDEETAVGLLVRGESAIARWGTVNRGLAVVRFL